MIHIQSVIIYLAVFSVSIFLLYFSQCILYKYRKVKGINNYNRRILGYFCLGLSITIPCLLAALRSMNVGDDVDAYIEPNFIFSSGLTDNGFIYFFENMPKETEFGFSFLLYIGNLFKSVGVSLFLIQLLIILPVYIVLNKYRYCLSVTLGMATFYFLCYNFSFSGMRGSIAMSLLLLDFYYLQHHDYKRAIPLFLFAALFHNSAILMMVFYCFILMILDSKYSRLWGGIFAICVFILFLIADKLLFILVGIAGLVSGRYAYYLTEYIGSGTVENVPLTDFLCKLVLLVLITLWLVKTKKFSKRYQHFFWFVLMGRIFVLFNSVFYEAMRIAFYFDLFLILYVASIFCCFKQNTSNRYIATALIRLPSFLYWIYFIMYIGAYQTNIYTFR